jgi:hypothetical protein
MRGTRRTPVRSSSLLASVGSCIFGYDIFGSLPSNQKRLALMMECLFAFVANNTSPSALLVCIWNAQVHAMTKQQLKTASMHARVGTVVTTCMGGLLILRQYYFS